MSYSNGTNSPFGLKPSRLLTGATWNDQTNQYFIDTTVARSIYTNDPVYVTSNGGIAVINAAGGPVTAQALLGSFQGCEYYDATNTKVFSPAWITGTATYPNTAITAFVTDDSTIIYDIQVSYSGTGVNPAAVQLGLLQTNFFQNAGIAVGGTFTTNPPANNPANQTGTVLSGQSVMYLDLANISNTATYPLKIIGLVPQIQNVLYPASPGVGSGTGAFNNALVIINNHYYKGGTGTAGV